MTPNEALAEIQRYTSNGQVIIVPHCQLQMLKRNVSRRDIVSALTSDKARCSRAGIPGRWKVKGPDRFGDELACVCVIESGVVVITVF